MKDLAMPKILIEYIKNEKPTAVKVGILKILSLLLSEIMIGIWLNDWWELCVFWHIICIIILGLLICEMLPTISLLWRYLVRVISSVLTILSHILIESASFLAIFFDGPYIYGFERIFLPTHAWIIAVVLIYNVWSARIFGDDISRAASLIKRLKREESYHQKIWWYLGMIMLQIIGIVFWGTLNEPTGYMTIYVILLIDVTANSLIKIRAIQWLDL